MAMAGLMKGHSNGGRGRPYGLMLLLAFGAAVIGVMVLHRFRERRIFNLLVKEKDLELNSLHLLLQKERDHTKEAKWKLEDMRAKVHILRAQKRALENRVQERQSTVSSLKEEERTIGLELEEKQNEIKLLRDRYTKIGDENPQVKALSDTLRQKESKIEDLRYPFESPVKVWSVSTDDPSKASVNLHTKMKTRTGENDETISKGAKESNTDFNVHSNHQNRDNTTEHADGSRRESGNDRTEGHATEYEDRRDNGAETVESTEIVMDQPRKPDHSKESSLEQGSANTEENRIEVEEKTSNKTQNEEGQKDALETETVAKNDNEVKRPTDESHEGHATKDKATETTVDGLLGRTSNAQNGEVQEIEMSSKGGMKLERPGVSQIRQQQLKGTRAYLRRAKGKRWNVKARATENKGNSDSNRVGGMEDRRSIWSNLPREGKPETSDSSKYDRTLPRNGKPELEILGSNKHYNQSLIIRNKLGSEDPDVKTSEKLPNGHGSKQEEIEDLRKEPRDATTHAQVETSLSTELAHISLGTPTNKTLQTEDSEASLEARPQHEHEPRESKDQASIQLLVERENGDGEDTVSEQTKDTSIDKEPSNPEMEDLEGTNCNPEMEDLQETNSQTVRSTGSTSNPEADGNEFGEKKDEAEF